MSASPDYAASAPSTPDPVSAPEMVSQMADVARAMFSLLTLGNPAHQDIPPSAVAEPADPPAVLPAPIAPSQASALPVQVPMLDINPPPAPAIASIAMPAPLPLLDYAPEAPAEAEYASPVTASAPPPNTAMLNEIGFLDD